MAEVDIRLVRKHIPKVAYLIGTRNFNYKITLFIGLGLCQKVENRLHDGHSN